MSKPTFQEFLKLTESPDGHYGNWDGGDDMGMVGKILPENAKTRLNILTQTEDYTFYLKPNKSICYVVNNELEGDLLKGTVLLVLKTGNFELTCVNKTGLQTNMVKSEEEAQRSGLAKTLYVSLIEHDNILICDYDQYDGARALWKSLGKLTEYHKYMYNEIEDTLMSLHNFSDDNLWSFDNSNKRYKLLVVSKKVLDTNPKY